MLTPSCEAKILQEMDFHKNDNVLVVGIGSGHLTECISYLTGSVTACECNNTLYELGNNNLNTHSLNREKIHLVNKNVFNFLDKIHNYTKVVFTCSVRSYDLFIDYLSENSKTFTFQWQDKSPYSSGIIIDKTRNSYTVSKNIVTSQTDLCRNIMQKNTFRIKEMMASNPILKIVDVREQWEFDKCHIENSEHIPMGKIPTLLIFWTQ